jgi:hypothetical protein
MSSTLAENALATKLPTIEPTRQLGFTDTDDDHNDDDNDDIFLLLLIRQLTTAHRYTIEM